MLIFTVSDFLKTTNKKCLIHHYSKFGVDYGICGCATIQRIIERFGNYVVAEIEKYNGTYILTIIEDNKAV